MTCNNTGTCLAYANAEDGTGRALFGMRPVSFYMFFNPPTLPNPSGFTVNSAYLFNIKYAPYSGITRTSRCTTARSTAAVSPRAATRCGGPNRSATASSETRPRRRTATSAWANNFQNLLDELHRRLPDAGRLHRRRPRTCLRHVNVTAQNKVLGDLSHDDQNYTFAVVGINQNFRPVKLDVCTPSAAALQRRLQAPAATNCGTDTAGRHPRHRHAAPRPDEQLREHVRLGRP